MLSILKNSRAFLKPLQNQLQFSQKLFFSHARSDDANVLKHKLDHYNSVTFDSKSLPEDPLIFEQMLLNSMNHFNEVTENFDTLQIIIVRV